MIIPVLLLMLMGQKKEPTKLSAADIICSKEEHSNPLCSSVFTLVQAPAWDANGDFHCGNDGTFDIKKCLLPSPEEILWKKANANQKRISDLEKRVGELEIKHRQTCFIISDALDADHHIDHEIPCASGGSDKVGEADETIGKQRIGKEGDRHFVMWPRGFSDGTPSILLNCWSKGGENDPSDEVCHPMPKHDSESMYHPGVSPLPADIAGKLAKGEYGDPGINQLAPIAPKSYSCTSPSGARLICGEGCKDCREVVIPFPDGSALYKAVPDKSK